MSVCHCLLGAWCLVLGTWHHPKIVKYFHISHLFSYEDLSQFGHLVEESLSSTLLKLTLSECLEYVFGMVCLFDNSLSKYNSTINNYENVNRKIFFILSFNKVPKKICSSEL